MEEERSLAKTKGYPDPINDTIQKTHEQYDTNIKKVIDLIQKKKKN